MRRRDSKYDGWYAQRTWLRDQTTNVMDLADAAANLARHGARLHAEDVKNQQHIEEALALGYILGTRQAWFQCLGAAGIG